MIGGHGFFSREMHAGHVDTFEAERQPTLEPRDAQAGNGSRQRSRSISRAALRPGSPVTPPPGWAPAPHRYSPSGSVSDSPRAPAPGARRTTDRATTRHGRCHRRRDRTSVRGRAACGSAARSPSLLEAGREASHGLDHAIGRRLRAHRRRPIPSGWRSRSRMSRLEPSARSAGRTGSRRDCPAGASAGRRRSTESASRRSVRG